MYITTVAPIEKGIFKESLSYFSKSDLPAGSLVSVPVRGRITTALVLSSTQADQQKAYLKSSDFSLKKVGAIIHPSFFLPQFISAAEKTSDYFATTLGQTLKFSTPKIVLDSLSKQKWPKLKITNQEKIPAGGTIIDKLILQDSLEERISFYRSLIREIFARNQSIFVVVPTAIEAEKLAPVLGKGIESYTIVLHSKTPEKEIINKWKQSMSSDHSELIITTPLFLSFPKANCQTIIIEKAASDDYFSPSRPHIDGRKFAENLAEIGHHRLIIGDTFLPLEMIEKYNRKILLAASPLKYRLQSEAKIEIINTKKKIDPNSTENKKFTVIGSELADRLRLANGHKKNSFILAGRRGLAPTTVCNDCDAMVVCGHCNEPLVLHNTKGRNRVYLCHRCGEREKVTDRCNYCNSWKLSPLGIGTEKVSDTISEIIPEAPVFILDSDHATTSGQAIKIATEFAKTPGSILIGTEMAIRYILEPLPLVGIASLDHMFSIPGFRSNERVMRLLTQLAEITSERFIIQTRLAKEKTFDFLENGNILEFYRHELEDRQKNNYPPFANLIKVSRSGNEEAVKRDLSKLARLLEKYEPVVYPAFDSDNIKYSAHLLIKIPLNSWPIDELRDVLRALPPTFSVQIDPADIL